VRLRIEGMLIDLGGIAKGYAARAAYWVLSRLGFNRALVAAGGDIFVGEAPPDAKGWKIAIESPAKEPSPMLLLTNAAVSTSGDANQFVTIGGKRYSHTVDPHTGLGLVGHLAVTIVATNGRLADGYTTAVSVLGIDRGMKLIEANPDLAARIVEVDETTKIVASARFKSFVAD